MVVLFFSHASLGLLQGRAKRGELRYLESAQAFFDDPAHYDEISRMCSYTHPRVWQDNPGAPAAPAVAWPPPRPRPQLSPLRCSCCLLHLVALLLRLLVDCGAGPEMPWRAVLLTNLSYHRPAPTSPTPPAADAPHKTFATLPALKSYLSKQHKLQFCDICLEGRKVGHIEVLCRCWLAQPQQVAVPLRRLVCAS